MSRVPFRVRLAVPVGSVRARAGWLLEGSEGWGEFSPLPSWSAQEREAALRAATEAATTPFPEPVRERVDVCALVPLVAPSVARRIAVESGCRTIKIKIGDDASEARVQAVRDALPGVRIRLDANGSWDEESALAALRIFARYELEYVEDPVPTMDALARVRRRSSVPVAAEACVRTIEDARRLRRLEAADVLVLKPQRIGGVDAALAAAEEAGVPAVPSSALETSVGLAAVLAVAAALGELPFAAGVGTASLLEKDVVVDPLLPADGTLVPRRPQLDLTALTEPVA